MEKTICLNGEEISYELTLKKVKNLNVRICYGGIVKISAPLGTDVNKINNFLIKKADWILQNKKLSEAAFEEEKLYLPQPAKIQDEIVVEMFWKVYNLFQPTLKQTPTLMIKSLKSMWGSCNRKTYRITINRELLYTSERLIEYVLYHEFVHFSRTGHQKDFYSLLSKYMPDYQERKKELNHIRIRDNI